MISRYLSLTLFVGSLVFSSCVPNRKVVYLQKDQELKEDVKLDTVVRTYDLRDYEYRIQPEDILSIRIESLTEEEFDIFQNQANDLINNANNVALAGYLVDGDGDIDLPVIGGVHVAGLTLHEIESKLMSEARLTK